MQLNRAENTATSSAKLQDQFLNLAENESHLPPDASVTLIDAFLQNLSNLLIKTSTGGYNVGNRTIKIMNTYLASEERIRNRFNPSR